MKKPALKTVKLRKLTLRSESIVLLTPGELEKVGGGWTWEWPCDSQSQTARACANEI
jgi:hypothetical protein